MSKKALVTGAGGFIGSHLVRRLKEEDYYVIGVDLKRPEFWKTVADRFFIIDLRSSLSEWESILGDVDEVYALAADMGGMGFISENYFDIFDHNIRINLNTIKLAYAMGAKKYLFTSSGCVYPGHLQDNAIITPLKETDAFPANPGDGAYSWEKLMGELVLEWAHDMSGMGIRIARFHNVYGPYGTYEGGREKVPAALCRKIAYAKMNENDTIEVWGDGRQTRSFMYIDDCIDGIRMLMESTWQGPVNLGSDRMISINDFVALIAQQAAGLDHIKIKHVEGPQGVRGRNSDNTLVRQVLDWEPKVSLEMGMAITYGWIEEQVMRVS